MKVSKRKILKIEIDSHGGVYTLHYRDEQTNVFCLYEREARGKKKEIQLGFEVTGLNEFVSLVWTLLVL